MTERHKITRLRHDARRRMLTLDASERLSPKMLRLHFRSPDLYDFVSASHDDHIKLFFPPDTGDGPDAKPAARDFTPRFFDTQRGTLTIDFALHDTGPATSWAIRATVGDQLEIGGPRGSSVVPDDFDWYLLVGDETALPAMGRRVEELRAGVPVTTFAIVSDEREAQSFDTKAAWSAQWIARQSRQHDGATLCRALASFQQPAGDGFIWIAAEASAARAVRTFMHEERGHPREWIKAAGYWARGETDAHVKIED